MAQLTKPSKNQKKSVADPSNSYHSLHPLWKKCRAVLQGEANVKAHDEWLEIKYKNLLLPFSPSMTQAQYDFYKAEAELPGLTSQYCKVLISALLRKKSHMVLPEQIEEVAKDWLETNFTLDGRSLFNFLDQALWEELQTSRCWIYVDYPKVSDQELDMMDSEERAMISPYPVIIQAENVINIQTDIHPLTRQKTLTRFITRSLKPVYKDNPWHPDYIDTVSDHYLDEQGGLVIDYYEHPDSNYDIKVLNGEIRQDYKEGVGEYGFNLVDTTYPQANGNRLTRIPAFALNGHLDPIEPVLLPLIDREVSLYNKVSRRNHLLYGAATYTPIVQSDMSDEEFSALVSAGLGSWLKVRSGESVTVLETPTAALSDMEKSIESTVAEMAKMGIRMLSPEAAASGIALEIRNSSQTAQLGTLNAKVSGTMREILVFMMNWKYDLNMTSNDIEFNLSNDFSPSVAGDQAMRLVTEWYQSGLIGRYTFISVAKFNDFLPADYNDEEAIEEIQTDPLAQANQQAPEMDIEE